MTPARLAILVLASAIAGCAVGPRTELREVVDGPATIAPAVDTVAVVAIAQDPAVRGEWEAAFAARLSSAGVRVAAAGRSRGGAAPGGEAADGGAVLGAARAAGAQAIVFVQPPSDVPIAPGQGAYRWMDARSAPDLRGLLDDASTAVTEVRLVDLRPGLATWHAYVLTVYPGKRGADPRNAADAVAKGLAGRGYLRGGTR